MSPCLILHLSLSRQSLSVKIVAMDMVIAHDSDSCMCVPCLAMGLHRSWFFLFLNFFNKLKRKLDIELVFEKSMQNKKHERISIKVKAQTKKKKRNIAKVILASSKAKFLAIAKKFFILFYFIF